MKELLEEIDAFLESRKMAGTYFGLKAVNDGKFVERLRKGGRCWPEKAQQVRDYIEKSKREAQLLQGRAA